MNKIINYMIKGTLVIIGVVIILSSVLAAIR